MPCVKMGSQYSDTKAVTQYPTAQCFGRNTRKRTMNTRTNWVDYAKAIGIVLVVYGHVARGLFNAGMGLSGPLYHLADSVVYSFHMPLFFFLSGLFFHHSYSKLGGVGLTLNKLDTIVYPYLLWSILQGGAEVVLSNYTNGNVLFSDVLALWNPRAQFWFLYALFLVFVVTSLLYYFTSQKRIIIIFILLALLNVNCEVFFDVQSVEFVAENTVFFVFGIIFMKYDLTRVFSSYKSLLATTMLFCIAQYLFHGYLGLTYINKGVDSLLLACISIVFVVSLSIALSKSPNRFLAYLGASSMAIYLMHILAGSGARVVLHRFLGVDAVAVNLVAGCLAGIFIPLLALRLINAWRIPYVFAAPVSKWLQVSYNKALRLRHR